MRIQLPTGKRLMNCCRELMAPACRRQRTRTQAVRRMLMSLCWRTLTHTQETYDTYIQVGCRL